MASNFFPLSSCKDGSIDVSLEHEPTGHDKMTNALSAAAKRHNITTKNGCTVTLIFSNCENPQIRREVAELLLRSVAKRSETI